MRLLRSLVCAVVIAAATLPAVAGATTLEVRNNSTHCAWFTVYTSSGTFDTWHILSNGVYRPQFIYPKQGVGFQIFASEVKVRAEVKAGPGCDGAMLKDTYDIRKDIGGQLTATLHNTSNGFNLWF